MDMEVRNFPHASRGTFSSKLSLYRCVGRLARRCVCVCVCTCRTLTSGWCGACRSVLADIKADVDRLRAKAERASLFSGPDGVELTESRSHREWLLATNDKCVTVSCERGFAGCSHTHPRLTRCVCVCLQGQRDQHNTRQRAANSG